MEAEARKQKVLQMVSAVLNLMYKKSMANLNGILGVIYVEEINSQNS